MASGQRPPRTEILLAGVDARVAGRGRRGPRAPYARGVTNWFSVCGATRSGAI